MSLFVGAGVLYGGVAWGALVGHLIHKNTRYHHIAAVAVASAGFFAVQVAAEEMVGAPNPSRASIGVLGAGVVIYLCLRRIALVWAQNTTAVATPDFRAKKCS